MLIFLDENGSPLPAGIEILFYPPNAAQTSKTLVATAWTEPGGTTNTLTLAASTEFVAVFVGSQAPENPQTFTTAASGTTTVTVSGYRAPTPGTIAAYTSAQAAYWVKNWFGENAPNATALASALSAGLSTADLATQYELSRIRVQSSLGPDMDSWFADFLGTYGMRFAGELDAAYLARGETMLLPDKTTLYSILTVVTQFYTWLSSYLALAAQADAAYDLAGGYDTSGSYDSDFPAITPAQMLPAIAVWDRQSEPSLANEFNINPSNDDYSFVIQLTFGNPYGLGWFLDNAFLDNTAFVLATADDPFQTCVPPDPRLGNLVLFMKAGGSKPIYLLGTAVNPPTPG